MADVFTKTTLVTTDAGDGGNYAGTSLTSSTYKWTASASGTNEYYCELSGGGDPSLSDPDDLTINGAVATEGTLGSLAAGEWGYGDNDAAIAFNTVYVRLSDGSDPDTQIDGYIEANYLPAANDNLGFIFSSGTLAGSDQSGVELDDIEIYAECTGNAGTLDDYLKLDQGTANSVVFAGLGTWYLDMGTSGSASVRVDQTATTVQGKSGLYFKNDTNAITLFEVNSGTVRLVNANITTLVVGDDATVYIDSACTVPTVINNGGDIFDYGAAITTWKQNGGNSTKSGSDDFAATVYGGTLYWDGTGTCTATTYGGVLDANRDAQTKTLTLTYNGGTVLKGSNTSITDTLNAPVRMMDI